MTLLIDTHAFLWFIDDDPRLSPSASERIGDPAERVLVSVVSLWEIVIKLGTGKLSLDRPPAELWPESLAGGGEAVAKIIPLPSRRVPRRPGSARGQVHMAKDFDATPEEFLDYL